ncbi:MAG: hypothetical protein PHT53_03490 [Candidatus Omnitrophica bacterium]|nr:hypothetical protein [Candidatus Omnitrophota bacterium]
MLKKIYNPQAIIYSLFLALAIFLVTANCFAEAQKVFKLMPRDTELLSQKQDKSQQFVVITTYKYGTATAKAKVLEFYRQLFKNEGYQELVGYTPEKQKTAPHNVYFFTKVNELAILSITPDTENGLGVYYIALHEPNVEAVRGLDTKEKQPVNE